MSTDVERVSAPLNEVMLAMDVVDTLRHHQDLVVRELEGTNRKDRLVERLRAVYLDQGIEVPDHILLEGVAALEENRFVYVPPGPSLRRTLAQVYAARSRWAKWAIGLGTALVLALGTYFFIYLPYQANQAEIARLELAQGMPAQMQALYDTIFEETKVQAPVIEAQAILSQGQTAASEGNRGQAEAAINALTDIRDTLRYDYSLRVVNRDGVQSGFWTFPEINRNATNYYVVVEAVSKNGDIIELPIANQETGETETVALWGLRVPQSVYNSVGADKRDDGIIQRNIIGRKEFGFMDVKYTVQVLGGAVTRW